MQQQDQGTGKALYTIAVILSLVINPFTFLILGPTNGALSTKVEGMIRKEQCDKKTDGKPQKVVADVEKEKEIAELGTKWGKLIALRSLLPCIAAGCAVAALCW